MPIFNSSLYSFSSNDKANVSVASGGIGIFECDWRHKLSDAWQSAVGTVASNKEIPYIPFSFYVTSTILACLILPRLLRGCYKYTMHDPSLPSSNLFRMQVPYEKSLWEALENPLRYLVIFVAFTKMWKTNLFSYALSCFGEHEQQKILTLDRVASICVFVVGIMGSALASGVAVYTMLIVGGIGGVSIAFAAREFLENVCSGLSIQFSKPFSIGDTVKVGSIEGQVVEMGLAATWLLNDEALHVMVPNSMCFTLYPSVLGGYEKHMAEVTKTIIILFFGSSSYNALDLLILRFFPPVEDKRMRQERTIVHTIISITLLCGSLLAIMETWSISAHSLIVSGGILAAATSFALKDIFESFLNGLWLKFSEPFKIGDRIMVKSEKLDGKVVDVRLTSITIIDKDTTAQVVVPYKAIMGKAIINLTRATHMIVEEKFTILLKDHDKIDNIIRCSNELILDISEDSFCEVSAVGEKGIELRVVGRDKMVNHSDKFGKKKLRAIRHYILIGMVKILQSSGATIGNAEKKKDDDSVKSEKLDGKVVDVRLTSITIIDKDTTAQVVVPYKAIMGKAIINLTRATHMIVEEKFTILLKDHEKIDNIIRCSNELILDISADSFCEVSAVGEKGIELRVVGRDKMVNHSDKVGKKKLRAIRHYILIGMAKILQSSGATIGRAEKKKDDDSAT
ncbi:hypothetical protein LWI28_024296 [Acer negundo]|uniref:Mechanosensitive ion channel MscS domain-containing protein n=1 Tax=Acer negundo TaxID=4023 RepID=A0AAD5NU04_ACENE|nr:hypothetical protein LWI28_024296 [Acer negundo]